MSAPGDSRSGPTTTPPHLDRWHRIGAAGFGLVLCGFGLAGLLQQLEWFSTRGRPIVGLSTNGLLSVISLVVGAILIAAGLRGGRLASTALVVFGAAFMLSGIANVLVLTTPLNVLAFGMSNVIFSMVAGATLLIGGAWGRFTGRLPTDNPYRRERHPGEGDDGAVLDEQLVDGQTGRDDGLPATRRGVTDITDARALAEAERAMVRRDATTDQAGGVRSAARTRSDGDRLAGWRRRLDADGAPPPSPSPSPPATTGHVEPRQDLP